MVFKFEYKTEATPESVPTLPTLPTSTLSPPPKVGNVGSVGRVPVDPVKTKAAPDTAKPPSNQHHIPQHLPSSLHIIKGKLRSIHCLLELDGFLHRQRYSPELPDWTEPELALIRKRGGQLSCPVFPDLLIHGGWT